ncbi:hypothetical protein BDN71DRAFT_1512378 [Pleurotus eryngii]|uniref:Fungal-type protein kinase domain-containing protein n=1 Tax=Pleurotus eryngii TaxID=5323 RepID=A0A9P6DB31_PLEER|nr:hypothetical protein BDN71DRAFT_1512378 [Pleurotus eryngii]
METSNSHATSLGAKLIPTPRTVCQSVARDLRTFRTARDLVSYLSDAMEAHQKAYEVLGTLHGDVSPENILIMVETRGILMDWDCSRSMCMPQPGARARIHRIRAWQFMSANLTMNPETASHGLLDDRESALHVLMYMAIRYLHHDKVKYLRRHLAMFDDCYVLGDGSLCGSQSKESTIMTGGLHIKFEIPAIKKLIDRLCEHFAGLYRFRQEIPSSVDPCARNLVVIIPPPDLADALEYHTRRFHQRCLQSIRKADWFYSLLREYIPQIPDRAAHETDWVDNTTVLLQRKARAAKQAMGGTKAT